MKWKNACYYITIITSQLTFIRTNISESSYIKKIFCYVSMGMAFVVFYFLPNTDENKAVFVGYILFWHYRE
jgi:hypothetical protein